MKLNELEILEDDFDLFVALDAADKIEFLFDACQVGLDQASSKQVGKMSDKYARHELFISAQEIRIGSHTLCITQYPEAIHLNSDSIKAIRGFVDKLFDDGLLLQRLDVAKSEFDVYRFLRVYEIKGKVSPFCGN